MDCDTAKRERIHLVEALWDIECLRLLGALTTPEYRRAVEAARRARPGEKPVDNELREEATCE